MLKIGKRLDSSREWGYNYHAYQRKVEHLDVQNVLMFHFSLTHMVH
jgi:hypothetical protein